MYKRGGRHHCCSFVEREMRLEPPTLVPTLGVAAMKASSPRDWQSGDAWSDVS